MFAKLFQQADRIAQSKSSALVPLQWFCALFLAGLLLAAVAHSPFWLLIVMATLLIANCLVALFAYVLFAIRNPDLLRSETYSLSKIAIERGLYGDSDTGVKEVERGTILIETEQVKLESGKDQR